MIKRKIPGSENKTEEGERTKFISLWEIVVEVFTRRGGGDVLKYLGENMRIINLSEIITTNNFFLFF